MNEMTVIVIRSFVWSIIWTVVFTKTTAGKEFCYRLGMWSIKKFTGFGKSSVCWVGDTRVWSVEFRDGSRLCVDRDGIGSRVRTTGRMAAIYNRVRQNLYTVFIN